MNKREAKREACFHATMLIETAMNEGGTLAGGYTNDELAKVESAMDELIVELRRRGWGEPMFEIKGD